MPAWTFVVTLPAGSEPMPDYDVIVVGLGGIGSGAAYWLAKRGARVLGIEQFELGHARGESHDHTRIIRLSYHTPEYVRLAKEAYAAWQAVENDSGLQLVYKVGGLDLGPQNSALPRRTNPLPPHSARRSCSARRCARSEARGAR